MPDAPRTPARLWLLAVLAVAEPLWLGVWFDGENLARLGGGAAVVANANVLLRIGSAALLALFVILTARQTPLHDEKAALWTHRPAVAWWTCHTLSYAALFSSSTQVFGLSGQTAQVTRPSPSWLWLLLWTLSAAATALTLASLLAPARAWTRALRCHAKVVLYSLCVGVFTWLLGLGSDRLWIPLGGATLEATARMLDLIEPEIIVIPETSVIATPHFGVEVAAECSGFEGMGLMAAFLLVIMIAGRSRLRSGRVLALLPFALAGMWLTNALRIAALVWLGTHVSATLAMGAFHSKAGWFLFCAAALALLAFVHRSRFFQRAPAVVAPINDELKAEIYNPTFVYLLPLGVQLTTSLLTSAFALHVDMAYGVRIVTIGATLWWLRRDLGPWSVLPLHWLPWIIGVLAYVLWTALGPLMTALGSVHDPQLVAKSQLALQQLPHTAYWAWVSARIVGSVLFVPIAEELAFRGFLLPRLINEDFLLVSPRTLTFTALFISSLAFGLLHDQWLAGTLCGLSYAIARWYRGRLGDAIIAHALTNALIALDVLLRGNWQYWL